MTRSTLDDVVRGAVDSSGGHDAPVECLALAGPHETASPTPPPGPRHERQGGLLLNACVSLALVACALAAYDRLFVQPSRLVGVVDIAEVYRLKEAEFSKLLATGASEDGRRRAQALAVEFAARFPQALGELPGECRCLVMVKSAVVGRTDAVVDLTALLKAKVGAR